MDGEGNFEADVDAQGWLVVVSPTGIPLLYSLAPQNWPPGVREVSLRLPSVRRVRQGVVVDEQDEPVTGLPMKLHSVQWNGENWRFKTTAPSSPPESRPQIRAADTTAMPIPRTDQQGNYSIAIYTGSTAEFQVGWSDLIALSTQERHVWRGDKRAPAKDLEALSKLKRVTLQFEDEQRQPLESIQLDQVEMYAGDQVVSRSVGGVRDVRGLNLFVDSAVDRIDLRTRDLATARSTAARWLPLETSIQVPGSDDQNLRITLPETLRQRPLSGRVLDPEGHPVAGVSLSLLRAASEPLDPRSGRGPHLGITTTSDAQGQFLFDAAPDDCRIQVWQNRQLQGDPYRPLQSDPLPGWTDPVDVDRQSRDVTIQLHRGGTVKVLLPQATENALDQMFLTRQDAVADDGRWDYEYFRVQSADPPAIVSQILPPGRYLLKTTGRASAFTEPLAGRGPIIADVAASAQAVIDFRDLDLRDLATSPGGGRLQPIKRSTDLFITHDGRPVSGADVMVFAAAARPEELARWIEQSQSDDAAIQEAALAMLSDAGALAIDAIKNAEQLMDRDQLRAELSDSGSTGLLPVVYDLSDNRGRIRCEVEAGTQCVAVARVRGQLIGWQSWIADGQAVSIDLQPSRTLAIRLADADRPDDDRHDLRWFDLKLQQAATPDTVALMSALCRNYGYPLQDQANWLEVESIWNHYYPLHQDDPTTWIMEDLPVGIHCTIRLHREPESEEADSPPSRSILIEPGDGVQMLRW